MSCTSHVEYAKMDAYTLLEMHRPTKGSDESSILERWTLLPLLALCKASRCVRYKFIYNWHDMRDLDGLWVDGGNKLLETCWLLNDKSEAAHAYKLKLTVPETIICQKSEKSCTAPTRTYSMFEQRTRDSKDSLYYPGEVQFFWLQIDVHDSLFVFHVFLVYNRAV